MKIIGKLSENLKKGDIFYKAIYCYDGLDTCDLIARCTNKIELVREIHRWLDEYVEDVETDYILVYEKEYISKEDGCKTLRVYEYDGGFYLIKDYTKEAN